MLGHQQRLLGVTTEQGNECVVAEHDNQRSTCVDCQQRGLGAGLMALDSTRQACFLSRTRTPLIEHCSPCMNGVHTHIQPRAHLH